MITDIVSTTGMLLAFVVILFLAWQASRYLGKNAPFLRILLLENFNNRN